MSRCWVIAWRPSSLCPYDLLCSTEHEPGYKTPHGKEDILWKIRNFNTVFKYTKHLHKLFRIKPQSNQTNTNLLYLQFCFLWMEGRKFLCHWWGRSPPYSCQRGRWSSLSEGAWCGQAGGKGRTASPDGRPGQPACHSLWRELWCSGRPRKWQALPTARESLKSMSCGLSTPNREIGLTTEKRNTSPAICAWHWIIPLRWFQFIFMHHKKYTLDGAGT